MQLHRVHVQVRIPEVLDPKIVRLKLRQPQVHGQQGGQRNPDGLTNIFKDFRFEISS